MAVPVFCSQKVSPNENTLFFMMTEMAEMIRDVGKAGGSSERKREKNSVMTKMLWSTSMLVYIEMASQVKSLVLGGMVRFESWVWRSAESFMNEGTRCLRRCRWKSTHVLTRARREPQQLTTGRICQGFLWILMRP